MISVVVCSSLFGVGEVAKKSKAESGVAVIKDSRFGSMTVKLPKGYRHVPLREFAKRRKACFDSEEQADEEAGETGWEDLENVRLYDSSTKQFMDISCQPYCWRVFVEKVVK